MRQGDTQTGLAIARISDGVAPVPQPHDIARTLRGRCSGA